MTDSAAVVKRLFEVHVICYFGVRTKNSRSKVHYRCRDPYPNPMSLCGNWPTTWVAASPSDVTEHGECEKCLRKLEKRVNL